MTRDGRMQKKRSMSTLQKLRVYNERFLRDSFRDAALLHVESEKNILIFTELIFGALTRLTDQRETDTLSKKNVDFQ